MRRLRGARACRDRARHPRPGDRRRLRRSSPRPRRISRRRPEAPEDAAPAPGVLLRKGYRRREVDEAVVRLERAFAEHRPPAAAEVRRLGFEAVRRGYEPLAVDRMLDRYELRCVEAALSGAPPWQLGDDLSHDVGGCHRREPVRTATAGSDAVVVTQGLCGRRVDALLDRCLAGLTGPLEGAQDPSADDVRLCSFHRARHGYAEAEVDEVFDRIIDLLLRQAGLRTVLAAPYVPPVEDTGYWATGFEAPGDQGLPPLSSPPGEWPNIIPRGPRTRSSRSRPLPARGSPRRPVALRVRRDRHGDRFRVSQHTEVPSSVSQRAPSTWQSTARPPRAALRALAVPPLVMTRASPPASVKPTGTTCGLPSARSVVSVARLALGDELARGRDEQRRQGRVVCGGLVDRQRLMGGRHERAQYPAGGRRGAVGRRARDWADNGWVTCAPGPSSCSGRPARSAPRRSTSSGATPDVPGGRAGRRRRATSTCWPAQALELGVEVVAVARATAAQDLQLALLRRGQGAATARASTRCRRSWPGRTPPTELAGWPCDVVLNGITGSIGLGPTLAALEAGRTLALANKESLIAGGPLVEGGAAAPDQIVPVDSEHSALAQCLRGGRRDEVRRLVLTASGGPFRGRSRAELARRHRRAGAGAPDLGHGPGRHDQLARPW